jgi:hypothetical protein
MAGANDKSLEPWVWDAACSIRGTKDVPAKAFKQVEHNKKLVLFYLPIVPKQPDEPVMEEVAVGIEIFLA